MSKRARSVGLESIEIQGTECTMANLTFSDADIPSGFWVASISSQTVSTQVLPLDCVGTLRTLMLRCPLRMRVEHLKTLQHERLYWVCQPLCR